MGRIDALDVLAPGLAGWARMDALHVAGPASVALVTATKPVARVDRGDKRKRRAVTSQNHQPGRKRMVQQVPIISRGLKGESPADGHSRPEKPVSVDWSIISAWK
nr:hypothetical protein [uncultured Albidiferax sp.]